MVRGLYLLGISVLLNGCESGSRHPSFADSQGRDTEPTAARRVSDGSNSAMTTPAPSPRQAGSALRTQDSQFFHEATMANLMEMDLGIIALENAGSEEVRQFGRRILDDHTRSQTELQRLARNEGIDLPLQLDRGHRQRIGKLASLAGAEFDREYMRMTVDDHQDAIAMFQERTRNGRLDAIGDYAARSLSDLREHLRMAQEIEAKLPRASRQP